MTNLEPDSAEAESDRKIGRGVKLVAGWFGITWILFTPLYIVMMIVQGEGDEWVPVTWVLAGILSIFVTRYFNRQRD